PTLPCPSSHTPSPSEPSSLSLHDALPISRPLSKRTGAFAVSKLSGRRRWGRGLSFARARRRPKQKQGTATRLPKTQKPAWQRVLDRKSTRLNSSHVSISYAVFCLNKKKES